MEWFLGSRWKRGARSASLRPGRRWQRRSRRCGRDVTNRNKMTNQYELKLFSDAFILELVSCTVGPLIIESFWAKKRVSTGAPEALDDPLVVQTKFCKSG